MARFVVGNGASVERERTDERDTAHRFFAIAASHRSECRASGGIDEVDPRRRAAFVGRHRHDERASELITRCETRLSRSLANSLDEPSLVRTFDGRAVLEPHGLAGTGFRREK
jgi:hypothetical protein